MRQSIWISSVISQGLFFLLLPLFLKLFSYLHPIVISVVWICLTLLVFVIVFWFRKETINLPYFLFLPFMILYSISLLVLLFFRPNDQIYDSYNLIPFSTLSFYLFESSNSLVAFYNISANIGLFIPYGIWLMVHYRNQPFSKWLFFGIPFSSISIIELLQYFTHRGSLDVDDLILNMLGVYLGYGIYSIFSRVVQIQIKTSK